MMLRHLEMGAHAAKIEKVRKTMYYLSQNKRSNIVFTCFDGMFANDPKRFISRLLLIQFGKEQL